MERRPYPSDLSTKEWEILQGLIPPAKSGGRPRSVNMQEIINGIMYVLRSGCAWRMMPHDLPPWSTVYDYFRKWRQAGVWENIHHHLRERMRQMTGREVTPSAGIVDSQSVKITHRGGVSGYDGAKKVKGRKRHLLVDTQGLLLKVRVHAANLMDWDGGKLLLGTVKDIFPRLELIWVDGGYKKSFAEWVRETLGWRVEEVKPPQKPRGALAKLIDPEVFAKLYPKGFRVLPRRWVVERTFAWIDRYRRFSKDYEFLPESSEHLIYIAMSDLMLKRLARHSHSEHL